MTLSFLTWTVGGQSCDFTEIGSLRGRTGFEEEMTCHACDIMVLLSRGQLEKRSGAQKRSMD